MMFVFSRRSALSITGLDVRIHLSFLDVCVFSRRSALSVTGLDARVHLSVLDVCVLAVLRLVRHGTCCANPSLAKPGQPLPGFKIRASSQGLVGRCAGSSGSVQCIPRCGTGLAARLVKQWGEVAERFQLRVEDVQEAAHSWGREVCKWRHDQGDI